MTAALVITVLLPVGIPAQDWEARTPQLSSARFSLRALQPPAGARKTRGKAVDNDRVPIPGSELKPKAGEHVLSAASTSQELTVTILLRRNPNASGPSEQDLLSGKYRAGGEGQAAASAALAADPADINAVKSFAEQYGLRVISEDAESRRIRVAGSVETIDKAFGVQLQLTEDSSGRSFLTYSGTISVPKALDGIVKAVLGLDQRPVAAPRGQ
jgi:kumamolisin